MVKNILFIFLLVLQCGFVIVQNIIEVPYNAFKTNPVTCDELQQMLDQYGTVCIIKDFSTQSNEEFILDISQGLMRDQITIGNNQELRIPAEMKIKLREENAFVLSGNGKIS